MSAAFDKPDKVTGKVTKSESLFRFARPSIPANSPVIDVSSHIGPRMRRLIASRRRSLPVTAHINIPISPTEPSPTSTFTVTPRRLSCLSLQPTQEISTAALDWVPENPAIAMDGPVAQNSKVVRWDGAARSYSNWDNLRRDPELWFRSGNCFVHLYGKGQSRRGPAFKVPFDTLLSAKCHPFVRRFMSRDLLELPETLHDQYDDLDRWNSLHPNEKIDLFVPAPPTANKEQAFSYHLATRNFLAWIFRRSMVGEHLGTTLISLSNSMAEFRVEGEDNAADLISYLDEEGYLYITGQPSQAVALLHLAESSQMTDMYIDAFSHCVGMGEEVLHCPEYQHIESVTKTLIKEARAEMAARLSKAGGMLGTFLEDELSEPHLSLSTGCRAHLDRFRAFVRSFYKSKLGQYPPPPSSQTQDSNLFDSEVLGVMRHDFEAVYELLADESFTSAESSPLPTQDCICVAESVNHFDRRFKFKSLRHPLSLLPEASGDKSPRRMSLQWLTSPSRGDKLKPDQRLVAHSALTKAMNMKNRATLENDLVRAYRKFEEDSVSPLSRADKAEKISLVDARKVRWILIYAVYQVLLSCTQAPAEVRNAEKASYHVAVSSRMLPPWKEGPKVTPRKEHPRRPEARRTQSVVEWKSMFRLTPTVVVTPSSTEIQPDIGFTAKSYQERVSRRQSVCVIPSDAPAWSQSRSSSRNNPFRRSINFLQRLEEVCGVGQASRRASYCEIVVNGYGNGVKLAKQEAEMPEAAASPRTATAPRSFSTLSESSGTSETPSLAALSSATAESTAPPTSPDAPCKNWPNQDTPMLSPVPLYDRRRVRAVLSFAEPSYNSPSESPDRRHSVMSHGNYAFEYEELVRQQEAEFHWHELEPRPLEIRKSSGSVYPESPILGYSDDVNLGCEHRVDVGGLTRLSPLKI